MYKNDLYNTDYEEYQNTKAKRNFKANAYIYMDTMEPENVGKVFVVDLNNSKTLFQALEKMWHGEKIPDTNEYVDGKEPRNMFNLMNGPDVSVNIKQAGQFCDYSVSMSRNDSAFLKGDVAEISKVISQCIDLEMFIDPEVALKAYDVVEEDFNKFISDDVEMLKSKEEANAFNTELKRKLDEEESKEQDEPLPTFDQVKKETKKVAVDNTIEFDPDDFFPAENT